MTPILPKIVEDKDAEDVTKHAEEHGDSDDEKQKPMELEVVRERMKRPPTASVEELELERQLEDIGDAVPATPDLREEEILDDREPEERSPKMARVDSPTSKLYPPTFAGDVRQALYVDEEQWECDMMDEMDGNEEVDNFFEERLTDENKQPKLEPDELERMHQESGIVEIERLSEMGVIVEPEKSDLENGVFLTTKEVEMEKW